MGMGVRVRLCPVRLVIAAVPDLLDPHTIHASFVLHKPQLTGAHAVHLHIRGGGPAPDHAHEVRLPSAALPEISACRAFHPTSARDDHVPKTYAAEVVHDAPGAAVVLRYRGPRTAEFFGEVCVSGACGRGRQWKGRAPQEEGVLPTPPGLPPPPPPDQHHGLAPPPPPQTKVTIVGGKRHLRLGKSDRAIFGTPPFTHVILFYCVILFLCVSLFRPAPGPGHCGCSTPGSWVY